MKIWIVNKKFRFGDAKVVGTQNRDYYLNCAVGERIYESEIKPKIILKGKEFFRVGDGFKSFCNLDSVVEETNTGSLSQNEDVFMHEVTSSESSSGYLTIPYEVVHTKNLLVYMSSDLLTNKQVVGTTGVIPDYDVLNGTELHINSNGEATGLSGIISEGSVLTVVYV